MRKLEPQVGIDVAIALADDLDNAVYEWGTFVESEMDRKEWQYRNEVAEYNASRTADSQGRMSEAREVSMTLVREARERAFMYWVHGKVREYLGAATAGKDGSLQQGGLVVLEKDAVYDGAKDWDMRDAVPIRVTDPDSQWKP